MHRILWRPLPSGLKLVCSKKNVISSIKLADSLENYKYIKDQKVMDIRATEIYSRYFGPNGSSVNIDDVEVLEVRLISLSSFSQVGSSCGDQDAFSNDLFESPKCHLGPH